MRFKKPRTGYLHTDSCNLAFEGTTVGFCKKFFCSSMLNAKIWCTNLKLNIPFDWGFRSCLPNKLHCHGNRAVSELAALIFIFISCEVGFTWAS